MLALDTSSTACSVAFVEDGNYKLKHVVAPRQHAATILAVIEAVLPCSLSELDLLAWGCGPGSFTGLRIAASVIQALTFTYNLSCIKISSLAALAQTAYNRHNWQKILVAVNAGIGQVYCASYCFANACRLQIVVAEQRLSKIDLITSLTGNDARCLVGDAWSQFTGDVLDLQHSTAICVDTNSCPSAVAVAQLALSQYSTGNYANSTDITPNYLHDDLFKINKS